MTNDFLTANRREENRVIFNARFSRCYRLLHFIACRVLGGPERADDAVDNCWLTASRNPPQFNYESEFRSWLLRVLIEEALDILREDQGSSQGQFAVRSDPFGARNPLPENELCC